MQLFIYYSIFVIFSTSALSQSLSVFSIDTSAFPVIKAKFYAFDAVGNQIRSLSASDFFVTENGQPRTVLAVSCPAPKPPVALSSVLVMDQSGSMFEGTKLDAIHQAAAAWINALPGKSECAITSFDNSNYIIQDFTTSKSLLIQKAATITANGGTDYDMALDIPMAGGIWMAKAGKYKRIIVMMSDGEPNFTPNTQQIINDALSNSVIIYFVSLGYPSLQCMKDITTKTGGQYFEKISTVEEAKQVYMKIMQSATGSDPCEISWVSQVNCKPSTMNVDVKVNSLNLAANAVYQASISSATQLEFAPSTIVYKNVLPGTKKDTIVRITARNADFTVSDIKLSNSSVFSIDKKNFILKKDSSIDLTISFAPTDSGYCICKFIFVNDVCPANYYARGGFPGKFPIIHSINLVQPNGGQVFLAGSDTEITWDGVTPQENVKLEYSIDSGKTWIFISDTASGLSYMWHVPNTPSNICLARVTAKANYDDCQVRIGNQIWMCKNLDVDHYRNGDSIPQVTDYKVWGTLTTGAWCYYNNSDSLGEIYGKLYNWYAVTDKRGLAPVGWHISSDADWSVLQNYLGGLAIAGGKLKEQGIAHWTDPNVGATDDFKFTALPGGYRSNYTGNLNFDNLMLNAYWWTSTGSSFTRAWSRYLSNTSYELFFSEILYNYGLSVRCVKD